MGDTPGAIEDYTAAIRADPNYALAYMNRARALVRLGNRPDALEDFQRAADLYQARGDMTRYQQALDQVTRLQR